VCAQLRYETGERNEGQGVATARSRRLDISHAGCWSGTQHHHTTPLQLNPALFVCISYARPNYQTLITLKQIAKTRNGVEKWLSLYEHGKTGSGINGSTGVEVHLSAQLFVLEEDDNQDDPRDVGPAEGSLEQPGGSGIPSAISTTTTSTATDGRPVLARDRQKLRSSQFLYPLPAPMQSPTASPSASNFFKLYSPRTAEQPQPQSPSSSSSLTSSTLPSTTTSTSHSHSDSEAERYVRATVMKRDACTQLTYRLMLLLAT
jgi:hypothetical protein